MFPALNASAAAAADNGAHALAPLPGVYDVAFPVSWGTQAATSSCSTTAEESCSAGGAEPSGWNLGQDDSALHGKHLPPSPRRQPGKSSLKAPRRAPAPDLSLPDPHLLPPGGRRPADRYSCSPVVSHRVPPATTPPPPPPSHPGSSGSCSSAPPSGRSRTNSDPQAASEPPQNHTPPSSSSSTSILRRKVLSKETVKQYQEKALLQRQGSRGQQEAPGAPGRSAHSTVHVPWEREAAKEGLMGLGLCLGQTKASEALGGAGPQDQGLLEEIESMCCLGSVLGSSLQLSQVHCNSGHAHVQGHAPDKL